MSERRRFMKVVEQGGASIDYGYNYIDAQVLVTDTENESRLLSSIYRQQVNATNCDIYIDDKLVDFAQTYKFSTLGEHRVVYKFNKQMTNLNYMFNETIAYRVNLNNLDCTKITNLENMFTSAYQISEIDGSQMICPNKTILGGFVSYSPVVTLKLGYINVSTLNSFAINYRNADLGKPMTIFDLSKCYGTVTSWDRLFRRQMGSSFTKAIYMDNIELSGNVQELFGWGEQNLEEFRIKGLPKGNISEFQYCTKLSVESLISILNALPQLDTSLDDDGNVKESYALTLGATLLAKLTSEQKAIATNKGWTLA